MIQTAHSSTSCLVSIKEYFQGKGPLYWKLEKINSIALTAFVNLAMLAGCALGISLFFGGGWVWISELAPDRERQQIFELVDTMIKVAQVITCYFLIPFTVAALGVYIPLSNHNHGDRPEWPYTREPVSSKIDSYSLADLTKWQKIGCCRWRHASWEEITDFYRSVRTPAELTTRMEKEGIDFSKEN